MELKIYNKLQLPLTECLISFGKKISTLKYFFNNRAYETATSARLSRRHFAAGPPSLWPARIIGPGGLPSNQLQNKKEKVDYIQVDVQSSKHILFRVQLQMMAPPHHQLHIHHQVLKEKKEK